ncbi:MAG: hypothetical protein RL014_1944 [Pseudomonadota bacterium]
MLKRWTWRALLLVGALIVVVATALAVYAWRSLPALDGQLRASGLKAAVQVRRDAADVTHIEAQSLRDASFAIGWVHAQERSWQLEFNRRVMSGTLSEVFGPATLETDKLLRTLGIRQAAQAQWARLPAAAQAVLQAYADGINAFHAQASQALPPEFHVLRIRPGAWTPQDSVGWALMMALDLGGNWGNEFARLSLLQVLGTEQLWQMMPPYPGDAPATRVDLAALYRSLGVYRTDIDPGMRPGGAAPARTTHDSQPQRDGLHHSMLTAMAQGANDWVDQLGAVDGKGSNNWVIAGERSASGKPIVANDPHLALGAPAIWYFARLKAPAGDGLPATDVIGATLPGLPMVVLGRTAGVAWGFTNTGPDVQDLYLEQIHPEDPTKYRTPEGWAAFESREEVIRVKGQPDMKLNVRRTRHGPVLSDAQASHGRVIDTRRFVLALRWSALDADNQTVLAGMQANFAQNIDELQRAFALHHSPMQNLVAADTAGQTAYRAIGRVPLRKPAHDLRGVAPAPGWDARYDWAGWLPADQVPQASHEQIRARGWHATANQRIHAADYPHFITSDWNTPERQQRIEALLQARPSHDLNSVRAIQGDLVSLSAQALLPVLRATPSAHPLANAAQALLKDFDGGMRADSGAALVLSVWSDELTRAMLAPRIGEERFKSLYGKRHFREGVKRILADPQASAFWCGGKPCAEVSAQALARALDRIRAMQGDDVARWRWGDAHPALSSHKPFGNVAALARFFDVSVPTGGDSWTVNVGQYWPNSERMPFANRHAASLRAIYDLSDLERSRFIYQTGQSGLVFSSRDRDMRDEWAAVRDRPLQLKPPAWAHQLLLTP